MKGDTRLAVGGAAGFAIVCLLAAPVAAGGLFIPGTGPTSSSRAGAWVAAADDPTALAVNPAGLNKQYGTVVYIGTNLVDYAMQFTRRGTYDDEPTMPLPWAGQPYPTVKNQGKPPIGFGSYQALPLVAVSTDLGLKIRGLRFGFGVFVPNSYPTRDMDSGYVIDDPNTPPPPTRYDVVHQEAAIILPSVAVAYRPFDKLDVGFRFSPAIANLDATSYTWGVPNYEEWTGNDSFFHVKTSSSFSPAFQLGALFRPTDSLEIGAQWSSQLDAHTKGTGTATPSSHLNVGGMPVTISPVPDDQARCAPGGTAEALKACVDLSLPMNATLGGRYVLRDEGGAEKGDVEVDAKWEHWSAASDYTVTVDGAILGAIVLNQSIIRHGLQDVYGVRVGGGYRVIQNLAVRGGFAYDTKAAKAAWERADLDGAARTTVAAGASYWIGHKWKVDGGLGYVYEGTRTQGSDCNPMSSADGGCQPDGSQTPVADRTQPDPIQPLLSGKNQSENPMNSGTFKSHYLFFNLAISAQF